MRASGEGKLESGVTGFVPRPDLPSNHHDATTISVTLQVMAYNREWDRGKDNWNDENWNGGGPSYARQRDDEYYGDGKRRKFNNGVSGLSGIEI
jgi:hypothetical protein